MFIKKDLRKIPRILADAVAESSKSSSPSEGEEPSSKRRKGETLKDLRLARRQSEFRGSVKILCQPDNLVALENLESLSLYDCQIQSLDGIGLLQHCPNLTTLNLGRNPISSIPEDLSKLSLKELWLEDCQLEGALPEPICALSTLRILRVSNNTITEIPSSIQQLQELECFCADKNQMESLPSELKFLSRLHTLLLRNNRISNLPEGIGELRELRCLHVSSNRLASFPDSMVDCVSLTHVYANSNLLETLPTGMEGLPALKRLNVGNNRIDFLTSDFWSRFGEPDADGTCNKDPDCVVVVRQNPVVKQFQQSLESMNGVEPITA